MRLFGRAHPDGGSAVLEAGVTGFTPSGLTALAPDGLSALPADGLTGAPGEALRGRRERTLGGGEDVITEALGQKVLHFWLQNRHQTLYPLTVNLRTLEVAQVAALAAMMAVAVHANRPGAQDGAARGWFAQAGADAAGLSRFDAAMAAPPALSAALAAVLTARVAAYGYVVSLVALETRDAGSQHFLDYLAVRLALPTTVVRSAARRYRR